MATRKFTATELEELGVRSNYILRTIVGEQRWSLDVELVFKHEGRYWRVAASEPATEYQDEDPWYDQTEVIADEVVLAPVTELKWCEIPERTDAAVTVGQIADALTCRDSIECTWSISSEGPIVTGICIPASPVTRAVPSNGTPSCSSARHRRRHHDGDADDQFRRDRGGRQARRRPAGTRLDTRKQLGEAAGIPDDPDGTIRLVEWFGDGLSHADVACVADLLGVSRRWLLGEIDVRVGPEVRVDRC
jgi:hypothetical protein